MARITAGVHNTGKRPLQLVESVPRPEHISTTALSRTSRIHTETSVMKMQSLFAIITVCALCCKLGAAQPYLNGSSVAGKLSYKPGAYFSEAIITPSSSTAYLSGQTGGSNATTIQGQTQTAMNSLNATITSLGSSLQAIVKTTIFMTNISDFSSMNTVYVSYFTPNSTLPARSTVQVASLVGTTQIEIEMVAQDPIFATMRASS